MDSSGNTMEPSGIINITNISQLETLMNDYNENFRYYNRNLRDMLELYKGMINDERERRLQRQRRFNANHNNTNRMNWNTNWNSNWNSNWNNNRNIFFNNDLINRYIPSVGTQLNNLRDQFNDLQDVIVRPTNQQIQTATQVIQYDISMEQQNCPISLEPFEQDESICIIKHCRHIFKRACLMYWFERNVRCPVCRYDIREYREERQQRNQEQEQDQDQDQDQDQEEELEQQEQEQEQEQHPRHHYTHSTRTNLSNNLISSVVRNLIADEMNRIPNLNSTLNDFLVTFNIPLEIDISYNNIY